MDYCRRSMWALHHQDTHFDTSQIPQLAAARFWINIADIADSPPPSLYSLPPSSLFFTVFNGRLLPRTLPTPPGS
jgi:hypothetical protein